MLHILLEDHGRIRKCADDLRALLTPPTPADPDQLARARWEMASIVMRHLSYEERHLYAQLENHPDEKLRSVSQAFRSWLSREFESYVAHAQKWTPQEVAAGWSKYRLEALHFLDMVTKRIREEEEQLFPLVGKAGLDTRQAAPPVTNWAKDAFAIQDIIRGGR